MMRRALRMLTGLVGSICSSYKKSFVSTKQSSIMKQKNIQQEVLVVAQTSFAQKALIDHSGVDNQSCPAEELEKGIWNGLLNEILPELMLAMQGRRSPDIIEDSYSIKPRRFLSRSKMN
jgi:hypothetical protein